MAPAEPSRPTTGRPEHPNPEGEENDPKKYFIKRTETLKKEKKILLEKWRKKQTKIGGN